MLGPYRAWPVGGTFHRGLSRGAHAAAEWNAVQDPSCNATKPISCAERVQYSGSGCELAFVRAACGTPLAVRRFAVRRSLLAVIAGLLQPESPLWPADFGSFGVGTKTLWRLLRERLSSAAIKELSVRAEGWHPILCEEAGFY